MTTDDKETANGGDERAEQRVPHYIFRSALYFHSLTEIWEYYRALGNNPPKEFMKEMARAERMMVDDLTREAGQGGMFHDWYKENVK